MNIKKLNERLSEYMDDIGNKVYDKIGHLYENARYSDALYGKIANTADVLVAHIYKMLVYSKSNLDCIEHWCKEIKNFLLQYCKKRLKKSNKPLTTAQIMQQFKIRYVDYEEMLDIFNLVDDDFNNEEQRDYEKIYNLIMAKLPQLIEYIKNNNQFYAKDIEKIILEDK